MQMKCLISVIIPVYNCDKFLKRAVESVIVQKNVNSIELILVNDGSSDTSGEICDFYANKYPNIKVIHQENSGVSAARNAGLDIAEGEWIAFLDSDDYLLNDAFIKMLKYADSDLISAKHQCNLTISENFDSFFEEGVYGKSEISETLYNLLASKKIFYPCWSRLYRNDIIKSNGLKFPVGVKIAEDMMFVYDYIRFSEKIAFVHDEVYYYYVNEDNTTNVIPKSFEINLKIFDWLMEYFSHIDCDYVAISKLLSSAFVYSSFDSVKTAAVYLSFTQANKYIHQIITNETFYSHYLKENHNNLTSKTDTALNKYILKRNSFMICIVMLVNKIKTKIATFLHW